MYSWFMLAICVHGQKIMGYKIKLHGKHRRRVDLVATQIMLDIFNRQANHTGSKITWK